MDHDSTLKRGLGITGTPESTFAKGLRFKWLSKVKPVGAPMHKNFLPLTEIPPPHQPLHYHPNGRRHLDDDCTKQPEGKQVWEGGKIHLAQEYYDDAGMRTVATIIFPDHIDHKHFEVTTQVPYLTVGLIDGIGYHPSTIKSEHPPECEKIYQDHIAEAYSDETTDFSEESLEVARVPLYPPAGTQPPLNSVELAGMYADMSL
ncbi:uncharacterized protein LOC113240022 [Hyposmocoma kahamanoa]|uniref:uncharacterized protein LOC113240022 n=1 Tax=Hyposmocoma kahamanoa TaxID=1477025 RepID=UPI000E6DA345|nr:uncharacterized protein LOC113240022 [Hyposmocoma kahamanoa]